MSGFVSQLTENLWIAQSRFYATNSGIFLSRDQVCLIDPCMTPSEIERLVDFVTDRQLDAQLILLTHSHWDHILGPRFFPGVKTLAQANYLTEVRGDNGRRIRQQIAEWAAENDIERSFEQTFEIPVPDETFVEKRIQDVGDDLSLTLVHAPGHAADQLVIYDAKSRTLWAADMLSDLEIPFVSDSLAAYQKTLDTLLDWAVDVLVPGHGHATSDRSQIRRRLSDDIAYLAELRNEVEQAIRLGRSVEETVAQCGQIKYRLPEQNAGPHRLNVESAYIELGGEADSKKVGWNGLSSQA